MESTQAKSAQSASNSTEIANSAVLNDAQKAIAEGKAKLAEKPNQFQTFGERPDELESGKEFTLSNVRITAKFPQTKKVNIDGQPVYMQKAEFTGLIVNSTSEIDEYKIGRQITKQFDLSLLMQTEIPPVYTSVRASNLGNIERGLNPLTQKPYIFPQYKLEFINS